MTTSDGQGLAILDGLFSSRVRVKILTIMLGQPLARYHGRELAKLTGEHFNAVWQELKHLEALGVLKAEKVGNQVQYAPDPAFPLLDELRNLFWKAQGRGVPATLPPTYPAREGFKLSARPRPQPFIIGETD